MAASAADRLSASQAAARDVAQQSGEKAVKARVIMVWR